MAATVTEKAGVSRQEAGEVFSKESLPRHRHRLTRCLRPMSLRICFRISSSSHLFWRSLEVVFIKLEVVLLLVAAELQELAEAE